MTMMRSLIYSLVLLSPFISYSQNCDQLQCAEGLNFTLYITEDGLCHWPIPATDFLDSTLVDCAASMTLAVYTAQEVIAAGPDFEPDFSGVRDTLVVDQYFEATTVINAYFLDTDGMTQMCETYLLLTEHTSIHCFSFLSMVSGVIQTYEQSPIANATVVATGGHFGPYYATTNENGIYSMSLPDGEHVIRPERLDNPINGVTTFDIVLTSKHILGAQLFDDPFRIIAADVNQSGTVTVSDLIQMRKLILNVITEFPNSPSWRFIPAGHVFSMPENPWHTTFPEEIDFNNNQEQVFTADFIGVKIGDVNRNAVTN